MWTKDQIEALTERFVAFIDPTPTERGCHLWRGYVRPNGYGSFQLRAGVDALPHRIAYALEHERYDVMERATRRREVIRHMCGVKRCVNPAHLELGSQKENIEDNRRDGKLLRGEQIGNSKLTETDVLEILRIYAAWPRSPKTGKPKAGVLVQLGKQFGVTRQMIWQIVHGKWWTHVQEKKND